MRAVVCLAAGRAQIEVRDAAGIVHRQAASISATAPAALGSSHEAACCRCRCAYRLGKASRGRADPAPLCSLGGALLHGNASHRICHPDHAAVAIDEVFAGGVPVGDWDWRNAVDASGHAVTIAVWPAAGRRRRAGLGARSCGKRHPRSGELMTSPVIADVLAIAGRAPMTANR